MSLAPIILFAYNRPWHTQQTLEALAANHLANRSTLYIFADGPKEHEKAESLQQLLETRKILKSSQWCREVIITERDSNAGLAASIIAGVTEVMNIHGKAIVLEDDILTSAQFLAFMNATLDHYEREEKIFGISGFTYPSTANKTGTHCLPIACSWGWASWNSRWQGVNFDAAELKQQIDSRELQQAFNFGNYPFYEMLADQVAGRVNSWAIRLYASMFLQSGLFVYPQKSLVTNIGFDGSATHTKGPDHFFDYVTKDHVEINFCKAELNEHADYVRDTFLSQFKTVEPKRIRPILGIATRIFYKIKKLVS